MKKAEFNGYPIYLVESVSEINEMLSRFSPKVYVGLDTETTGLSYLSDKFVGVSISGGSGYAPNSYAGYYLPVRHDRYSNLPVSAVLKVVQHLVDNFATVFWNRNFDLFMLENEGLRVPFVGKMNDGQIMAYLLFNEPYPALKEYAKRLLKWQVVDFESASGGDHNFGHTNPEVSFQYAASDSLMTVMLAVKMWNEYPYIRQIYPMDNLTLEAVRRMSKTEIPLDYDFLDSEREKTVARLKSLQNQIYSLSGIWNFNINSSAEKAQVLSRFVTLTEKTAKGKFKTDEDTLARLNHPLANLMIEYSHTKTYLGSFVEKMCGYRGRVVRGNYNTVNVPSGRLSSGGSPGNDYYIPQNLQNCLVGDTRVFTLEGMKFLKDVIVGDRVWDGDDYQTVTNFVCQGVRQVYRMVCVDGKELVGTADHPILTENGFRPLGDCAGKYIILGYPFINKGLTKVRRVFPEGEELVYDITVEGSERFSANGIIVHNCPKEEVKMYVHPHPVIGYCLKSEEEGCVRDSAGNPVKSKTKSGLRKAFCVPKGDESSNPWVWVTADYCLDPETKVISEEGEITLRKLLMLPPGVKILTPQGFKETYHVRWTGDHSQYRITLRSGESVICSPEHKFAVTRGEELEWVRASLLSRFDYLVTQGGVSGIANIEYSPKPLLMIDLGVRDVHCFYANGILTHNCAQELRLAAVFSKEPNLLTPLVEGKDIHMYVAKKMFGYEDPNHRTNVKIVNFCLGEDSYVHSAERGFIHPSSLHEDDLLIDRRGRSVPFAMRRKVSDTITLSYSNGVIEEYEYRHKLLVRNKLGRWVWRRVQGIVPGDAVKVLNVRDECEDAFYGAFWRDIANYVAIWMKLEFRGKIMLPPNMEEFWDYRNNCVSYKGFEMLGKNHSVFFEALLKGISSKVVTGRETNYYYYSWVNDRLLSQVCMSLSSNGFTLQKTLGCVSCIPKSMNRVRVVSVEYRINRPIYVISTPSHNYISSNVISHNSKLYGAEWFTISQRTGLPKDEAKALCENYDATMSRLTAWKKEVIKNAKRSGFVKTLFGRPVYLMKFYNSPDYGMQAYANRLAVNATIQGCVPSNTLIRDVDKSRLVPIGNLAGRRVDFSRDSQNPQKGVPTGRGRDTVYFIRFTSGDFAVVSTYHKFKGYKSERLVSFQDKDSYIELLPPGKKYRPVLSLLCSLFVSRKVALGRLYSLLSESEVPLRDLSISSFFFKVWRSGSLLNLSDATAAQNVRVVADEYGFNLVHVSGDFYRVRWGRKRKAKVLSSRVERENVPIFSASMMTGWQTYPLSGFTHKNTGADLMRRALIKFEQLRDTNEAWRDNTRFATTVHDECNFYVRSSYLPEAVRIIQSVMNFQPKGFEVPIEVEVGVSPDGWGNCLDIIGVTPEGKIIPKDYPFTPEGEEWKVKER